MMRIDPRSAFNAIARGVQKLATTGAGAARQVTQQARTVPPRLEAAANWAQDRFTAAAPSLSAPIQPLAGRLFPPSADSRHDGALVGAGGETFPRGTPLSEVPAYTPRTPHTPASPEADKTFIYVNGINTSKESHDATLQAWADHTGGRVVGIYNATDGGIRDLVQVAGDTLDVGENQAVDTLADTVYDELQAGREVNLLAHSQGALITSRALTDVKNRLILEDGLSPEDAETLLGNVKVETFGGAASQFPDGPEYVHYVNDNDAAPLLLGVGYEATDKIDLVDPGKDAEVRHFASESMHPLVAHSITDTYIPARVPFDEARGT